MSDDSSLIRAIVASPQDDALRLVYADWLEERGDARAEYLRLLCRLGGGSGTADVRNAILARLDALRAGFDPQWVGLMHRGRPLPRPGGKGPAHLHDERHCTLCRPRRRPRLNEAEVTHFLRRYARPGGNDRHYSREFESRVKRMRPEDLDRLMRGEDD